MESAAAADSARTHRALFSLVAIATLLVSLPARSQLTQPLIIKAQGSFFIGGEEKRIQEPATAVVPALTGEVTVNQMYVQYQIPVKGDQHLPVVMVHGCCLSSKTWETTPDGRMGWSEYFVRHDRKVYLVDQASRARSGFDPTAFYDIQEGKTPTELIPSILTSTHQLAWTMFRFGPRFGEVFPDQQFPMQAVDEFYKQLIPDLNSTLPDPNPSWTDLAALGKQLKGAILIAHSESGFYPERAALIDPKSIKGIVSIETQCDTGLTAAQIAQLSRIPTMVVFGDHLGDVALTFESKDWSWADMFALCNTFVDQIKKAGGDAEMVYLPALGIKGNSHMLMQDRNSDRLAQLVLTWIDQHVESKKIDVINQRQASQ